MEYTSIISHAASVFGGSIGTLFFNYLRSRSQDRIDNKKVELQEDQQAFLMYKGLVDHLNASVLRMEAEIKQLTKDHHDCMMKNSVMVAQVQLLEAKIKSLEEKLKKFENDKTS